MFEAAEVRQLLYGSGRSTYRILFYIQEGMDDEPGTVRILHVRHGSQRLFGQTERSGDEDDTAS